jgi:hypothetical protein
MPGGFTPNGSVKWFLKADRKDKETDESGGKWRLEGKDGTEKNNFFWITIKHPSNGSNRVKFLAQLAQHVARALADPLLQEVTLCMPVEDRTSDYQPPLDVPGNYDPNNPGDWQIHVDWSRKVSDLPAELRQGWQSSTGSLI